MYTNGFVPIASDSVTIGTPFTGTVYGKTQNITATYLSVGTGGGGDIVWKNAYGDLNWLPATIAGTTYILGATEIMASGTVNGTPRTTTASAMTWFATSVPQ